MISHLKSWMHTSGKSTTEIIDPLDVQKKKQELQEKIDTLLKELDTQIKVSNATTMIEF